MLRTLGFLFLLFAMVVLGWGYWHMVTHATLNLSLHDVSLKTDRLAYGQVMSAEIVFMNAGGGCPGGGSNSRTVWSPVDLTS